MFFEYNVWINSTISIIQETDKMHSALITTGEKKIYSTKGGAAAPSAHP